MAKSTERGRAMRRAGYSLTKLQRDQFDLALQAVAEKAATLINEQARDRAFAVSRFLITFADGLQSAAPPSADRLNKAI
jgi:hypothetical protein